MADSQPVNPYRAPSVRQPQVQTQSDAEGFKHSGPGIVSCVLNLLILAGFIGVFVILAHMIVGGEQLSGTSPVVIRVGMTVILMMIGQLVALVLTVVGLCQTQRKKLFAILAVVLSCLMVLLWIGCFILGYKAPV